METIYYGHDKFFFLIFWSDMQISYTHPISRTKSLFYQFPIDWIFPSSHLGELPCEYSKSEEQISVTPSNDCWMCCVCMGVLVKTDHLRNCKMIIFWKSGQVFKTQYWFRLWNKVKQKTHKTTVVGAPQHKQRVGALIRSGKGSCITDGGIRASQNNTCRKSLQTDSAKTINSLYFYQLFHSTMRHSTNLYSGICRQFKNRQSSLIKSIKSECENMKTNNIADHDHLIFFWLSKKSNSLTSCSAFNPHHLQSPNILTSANINGSQLVCAVWVLTSSCFKH